MVHLHECHSFLTSSRSVSSDFLKLESQIKILIIKDHFESTQSFGISVKYKEFVDKIHVFDLRLL